MSLESFGFKRISTSAATGQIAGKKEKAETNESEISKPVSSKTLAARKTSTTEAKASSALWKKRVSAEPSGTTVNVPLIQAKLQVPSKLSSDSSDIIPQPTSGLSLFVEKSAPNTITKPDTTTDVNTRRKKRHISKSSQRNEAEMADESKLPQELPSEHASESIPIQPGRKRRKGDASATSADAIPIIPTEYSLSRPRRSVAVRATTYREKTESDIEDDSEDKPAASTVSAVGGEYEAARVVSASSERRRAAPMPSTDAYPPAIRPHSDVLQPILPVPALFPPPRSFSSNATTARSINPSYRLRPFNLLLSLRAREMSIVGSQRMDGGMTPSVAVKLQTKPPVRNRILNGAAIDCSQSSSSSPPPVAYCSLPSLYHSSLRSINFDQLGLSSFPRALINRTATYSRDLREQSLPCLVKNRFEVGAGGGLTASQFKGYSMNFSTRGEVIGIAGHAGVVKLFHCNPYGFNGPLHAEQESVCEDTSQLMSPFEADYMKPICTFVGHSKWISCLKFLDPSVCQVKGINSFITTGDDSHMHMWNAETVVMEDPVREGLNTIYNPKSISSKQPHGEYGIYHMDVFGDRVASCSKDGSVVVSQLTPFDISAPIVKLLDYHSGQVVKHVAHRDSFVLASGGNDRAVNIFDIRSSKKPNSLRFEQLHSYHVLTVAWNPSNPYQLMSSSSDCRIQLLDIRVSDRGPIHTLAQHFPRSITRAPSIFHPIYMHHGNFILTATDSNSLFLYSATTGELLRTWDVGFSSSQLAAFDDPATGQSSFVTYSKRLLHRMTLKFRTM